MTSLADRLAAAFGRDPAADARLLAGDDYHDDPTIPAAVQAAVLIAVTDRAEPGVILTQRTDTMRSHPGQIAFPGGRVDPTDASPVAAALREAREEIDLPPATVTVIGTADLYRTITGFVVTPVLGVVPPDLSLRASEAEVADVFEVPLAFLLDPANQIETSMEWEGVRRHFYEIIWNDRRIWGATAAIIVNLSRRLQWA